MASMVNRARAAWVVDIDSVPNETCPSVEEASWKKHSVYHVPPCIKDLNDKAYQPQVVSLGPFHHRDPNLLPMDKHKQRSLIYFLRRARKPMKDLMAAMEEVAKELEGAYEDLGEEWRGANRDRFWELMIMDGCFLLEVMRTVSSRQEVRDYQDDDPVFSKHGELYVMPYIRRDMLMIENQLPLLVLKKLLEVESCKEVNNDSINKMVLKFLSQNSQLPSATVANLGLHPLDVFRKSLLHDPQKQSRVQREGKDIIRSAMELYDAGIWFRKIKVDSLWVRDIWFSRGFLHLPVIVVDDSTEYTFLNMMAFERLHVGAGNHVSAYVLFMDNLIDSAKDVALLTNKGIIENTMGSDKEVAKLFNGLSKDVVMDQESELANVRRDVYRYCKQPWNKWRANLYHTYFHSPWASLSLAAAVFLLVLTVMQTVYAALQVHQGTASNCPMSSLPAPAPVPL